MRTLLGMAVALTLTCGFATAQIDVGKGKLVGTWELKTQNKDERRKIEFTEDDKIIGTNAINGKIIGTNTINGKEEKTEGTYTVTKDGKLTFKMKYKDMDIEATVTLTKLTDDEMVGVDKEGKSETYVKVKPK